MCSTLEKEKPILEAVAVVAVTAAFVTAMQAHQWQARACQRASVPASAISSFEGQLQVGSYVKQLPLQIVVDPI